MGNSTRGRILAALREADGFLSGQELSEQLSVTRTAVWKAVQKLQEEGYRIQAVRNRGYRLQEVQPDILSSEEIEGRLKTKWAGNTVYSYTEVDSTNNRAKQLAEEGAPHGTLVMADIQTAGKGRRGRSWSSPSGSGIWMTLILKPDLEPSRASMLTLVMAHSVTKAIRMVTGLDAGIKWPNDVVVNGRKVCGILTEMSAEIDFINHIVIGFGINANITSFPEEIGKTATSLELEMGQPVSRADLAASVLEQFEVDYQAFLSHGDLSALLTPYNDMLLGIGQQVRVLQPGHEYTGISAGINRAGELLVKREDGTVTEIYAGEVSVRGLYGYV